MSGIVRGNVRKNIRFPDYKYLRATVMIWLTNTHIERHTQTGLTEQYY